MSSRIDNSGRVRLLHHPQWSELDWLAHGFSTRRGGFSTVYSAGVGELNLGFTPADDRAEVLKNRELLLHNLAGDSNPGAQLKTLSQIHSSIVHAVSDSEEVPPGDGMVTATPGVYLGIQTADCVPVLMVDRKQRVVAAVHAGWRGTVSRIADKGVKKMRSDYGSDPGDLMALIGPSIGGCCYAVGEELHQTFTAAFPYAEDLFTRRRSNGEDKLYLDLGEANRRQLIEAGVEPAAVHHLGGCTSCQPETYFSHRQSKGHTGRMMSVVGIRRD